ncbi:GNAT family N-acetyltransferase [Ruminococcaceae bacterium OttesenSCG-928-D13]|nr:GNAT family N-acetyltransferase [Ruminococcaceae bacterium OttesenSCG-928-D13]
MYTIQTIAHPAEKAAICNTVLRALPEWFGIESAIVDYVEAVREMTFFAALQKNEAIGFAALLQHSPFASEMYVLGLLPGHHRQGLGRQLVQCCEEDCRAQGVEFLTVKTLADTHPDPHYAKTRAFYLAMGYRPLEVFPLLWGEDNPCLLMAKHLPAGE